jgi:D-glycero-D-manno-heptose 1,7-bisphosphate phosphatase
MRRAVFLDRDGVLNEAIVRDGRAYAPLSIGDFHILEDAPAAVERLRTAGLICIVFTNQPEIARGLLPPQTLDLMYKSLLEHMTLDDILFCPHDSSDGCECHKPKPGMLIEAAQRWDLSLADSFVVGARWRDIGAGLVGGCFSILLERPYSACAEASARVQTLNAAVDLIIDRMAAT